MVQTLARKIQTLRRSLGENQAQFGDRFDVTQGSVSRWENGAMPDPGVLSALAELAGEDIRTFLGGDGAEVPVLRSGPRLLVKGEVAAGVWVEAFEWPQDQWEPYTGGTHVSAPSDRRFGLRVVGESMNMVYPHGTILDCVSVFDTREIRTGQNVIVVRRRADDSLEATVKEFHLDGSGRYWLVPRSNNPSFQRPIPMDEQEEGIVEVSIVAVVVGSYRPEH